MKDLVTAIPVANGSIIQLIGHHDTSYLPGWSEQDILTRLLDNPQSNDNMLAAVAAVGNKAAAYRFLSRGASSAHRKD